MAAVSAPLGCFNGIPLIYTRLVKADKLKLLIVSRLEVNMALAPRGYVRLFAQALLDFLNEQTDELSVTEDGNTFAWVLDSETPEPRWLNYQYGRCIVSGSLSSSDGISQRSNDFWLNFSVQLIVVVATEGQADDGWLLDWQWWILKIIDRIKRGGARVEQDTPALTDLTKFAFLNLMLSDVPSRISKQQMQDGIEIAEIASSFEWQYPHPISVLERTPIA